MVGTVEDNIANRTQLIRAAHYALEEVHHAHPELPLTDKVALAKVVASKALERKFTGISEAERAEIKEFSAKWLSSVIDLLVDVSEGKYKTQISFMESVARCCWNCYSCLATCFTSACFRSNS